MILILVAVLPQVRSEETVRHLKVSLKFCMATFLGPRKVGGPCQLEVGPEGGCWRLVGWLCGQKWVCPSGRAYDTLGAYRVHFRLFQPYPWFMH